MRGSHAEHGGLKSSNGEAHLGRVAKGDQSMRGSQPLVGRPKSSPCEANFGKIATGDQSMRGSHARNSFMKRISSTLILWWYKGIGLWVLGAVALIANVYALYLVLRGQLAPAWLLAPVLLTAAGIAYIRRFVLPLADEVFDDGDALVVRRGKDSVRIPLRDIGKVEYSLVFDPPRIALYTATAGKVVFMPYLTPGMCFFREHPLVAELRKRCAGSSS